MADDTLTVNAIRAEIIVEVETFADAADMTHEVTVPHVEWMTAQIDALIAAVRAENALAEQACRIAAHQLNGRVHALTCGLDSRHAPLVPFVKDGRIALRCLGSMTGITPTPCPYVQDWVPPVES